MKNNEEKLNQEEEVLNQQESETVEGGVENVSSSDSDGIPPVNDECNVLLCL